MLDEDLPVKIFKIPILDSHSNVGDGDGDDGVFPRPLLPDDGDGDGEVDGDGDSGRYFPNLCLQMMVINPSQGILEAEEEEEERKEVSHSDFFLSKVTFWIGLTWPNNTRQ